MVYFTIGILLIIALRMLFYLKRCEYEVKQNPAHEFLSIIFSVYLLILFLFLKDNVIPYGLGELKLVLYFLPFGFFMPMIFRRFRYLLLNIVVASVYNLLICFLQIYTCKHTNFLNIMFSVFGVLIGFIFYAFLREFIPQIKKGFLVEKKRKKPLTVTFEAEITAISIIIMIAISVFVGNIFFEKQDEKLKGEAQRDVINEYGDIYYSHKENYIRYDKYKATNPQLSLEDVVWRVEVNLDQEFYDDNYISIVNMNKDNLHLLNKFNRVPSDFEPDNLVKIEGEYQATSATAKAYQKMLTDMEKENLKIYVVSSYRSISYQENLYNYYLRTDSLEEVDSYSSRSGHSEHHTGRALDISQVYNDLNAFEGSKEAKWIYDNSYKYGFIVRYTQDNMDVTGYIFEPWHITYVGQAVSQLMHNKKIETLEEYFVKYIYNTP